MGWLRRCYKTQQQIQRNNNIARTIYPNKFGIFSFKLGRGKWQGKNRNNFRLQIRYYYKVILPQSTRYATTTI